MKVVCVVSFIFSPFNLLLLFILILLFESNAPVGQILLLT